MRRPDDPGWGYVRAGLIGAVMAVLVMAAVPVGAAIGDALKLGQGNSVDAVTSLSGSTAANLRLTNTQADKPALDLHVASGAPPLQVDSGAWVRWLNADRLDGHHASFFAPAVHDHDTTYLGLGAKAADADKLDGKHLYQVRPVAAGCSTTDAIDGAGSWQCDVNINPTTSGTIIFSGSLGGNAGIGATSPSCDFRVDGVLQTQTTRTLRLAAGETGACASEGYVTGLAAGPHTVYFTVYTDFWALLQAGSVEVLFVPTG